MVLGRIGRRAPIHSCRLRERLVAFPGLTAVGLWHEMRERGYAHRGEACSARLSRSDPVTPFEVRFETPPSEQAEVDLAGSRLSSPTSPG